MFVFIKKTPDRFVCMLEIELKFLAGFSHFPVILQGAHIGMQATTFFFFFGSALWLQMVPLFLVKSV